MDAIVTQEGRAMHTARSTLLPVPFITLVKGIAGCAVIALCFAGAGAALTGAPFSPVMQSLAAIIGAGIGGILAWRTGLPSAEE